MSAAVSAVDLTACMAPGSEPGAVLSVPELIASRGPGPDLDRLRRLIGGLRDVQTKVLVARLETTDDPLVLWAMHLVLDSRDVPPCLRWPANDLTLQHEFITLLADLLWFTKRSPSHRAKFKGWQGLLNHPPGGHSWHCAAHRQYLFVARRYSVAHWCATGLALSDAQRQPLMVLQTNSMRADRQLLRSDQFAATRRVLLSAAMVRPDKANMRTPADVAGRRAALWRTYILAGRSATRAAEYWCLLTGEQVSRQAISKHIVWVDQVRKLSRRTGAQF